MAAKTWKSEFYRNISTFISFALICTPSAQAFDIDPSRYSPFAGDKFYLLAESTFGSAEVSKIRLEVAGSKDSLEAYGGVDVRVYKIPQPLEFLKKQKNLHRPSLKGNYTGEGLQNALNYLWDSWYKKSRLAFQRVFSFFIRKKVVEHAPELKQVPPFSYQTKFNNNPQFSPLPGLPMVEQFRYPFWNAKAIAPPAGVKLEGSSSQFLEVKEGNVYIPLGKREPGLYLVEAMIGTFRASAFLFVSDSVAITKLSSNQELVWTVDKKSGQPKPGTRILFTDGVGVLGEGRTDRDGVFILERKNLERSYALGQDAEGGIFVSENFYYDSEIYGNKLYIFTDRPLYRPGDRVHLKLMGRAFRASTESGVISASPAQVLVSDSAGTLVINRKMNVSGTNDGGDASFHLPSHVATGGYNLEIRYKDAIYASAFRVANYIKPHFEVEIGFTKPEFKLNEVIHGRVQLNYPNGDPVKGAKVEVNIRKQKLTIVEGELQYLDRFPVQVSNESFASNDHGLIEFQIPATAEPSRYVVSVRAVDQSTFRVTSTKEILVQASSSLMLLTSERNFSAPNEKVVFKLAAAEPEASGRKRSPASWEAIRLQDQSVLKGELKSSEPQFQLGFAKAGSYMITVKDSEGITLAGANHWVQGPELAQVPGTISVLLDKSEYEPGDKAQVLVTFSEPVSEALVTLERDRVEKHSLLTRDNPWIQLNKVSEREYKGEISIQEAFNPNITFSVAYVRNGQYFFENKGIKVATPKVLITFRPDKAVYQPGETVTVAVQTSLKGKPVASTLAVGVVDEMIYVLQPEIAPEIGDFFYHPRRNQVRTSSSLSFHSYDVAASATGISSSSGSQYSERSLKLRERPRREEKDTAFWEPTLKTDGSGRAQFSFVMPDSLTRWRITGRAMTMDGMVGQKKDFLRSQKDLYLKWTGPTRFRKGDQSQASLVVFNLTDSEKSTKLMISGPGSPSEQNLKLRPGSNYVTLPLKAEQDGELRLALKEGTRVTDELTVKYHVAPVNWLGTQTLILGAKNTPVPKEAFNIRISSANSNSESFFRVADSLADYPYGCVEQTSSRLLPLALIYPSLQQLGQSDLVSEKIQNQIVQERLRLMKLAGPEAHFSWWGNESGSSAFLTAYAYYTDWLATKALGIKLPAQHWENVLKVYQDKSGTESILNRALILWMFSEMGLPIKTLTEGVLEAAETSGQVVSQTEESMYSSDPEGEKLAGWILLDVVREKSGLALSTNLSGQVARSKQKAAESKSNLARSSYLLSQSGKALSESDKVLAEGVLNSLVAESPTLVRGLSLAFVHKALSAGSSFRAAPASLTNSLGPDWAQVKTKLGRWVWQYRGSGPLKEIPAGVLADSSGSVHLTYDSYQKETSTLPVQIERKLFKLTPSGKALQFEMSEVGKDWVLSSKDLYLDEITLVPKSDQSFKFGLMEVPLPTGAEVEQTTWGISITDRDGSELSLGKSSFQMGDQAYSVGIEELKSSIKIRHLVRFSQVGEFQVPMARFFRMYSPTQKAFEEGHSAGHKKIVVR